MHSDGIPSSLDDQISRTARTLQIIVGAICLGAAVFLGIAITLRLTNSAKVPAPSAQTNITWVSCGFAGLALVVRMLLPALWATGQRRSMALDMGSSGDSLVHRRTLTESGQPQYRERIAQRVLGLASSRAIVGSAILEGASLLAILAYYLEGRPWVIAVAVVLIGALLAGIPTRDRLRNQLDSELRAIEDLQSSRQ